MKTIFTLLFTCLIYLNISAQCFFTDLVAEAYPCDSIGQFLVDVDFNITGGTDSFEIRGNGNSYGFFDYNNLPVTIGPLTGDCTTDYEVVVIDADLADCNADVGLGVICCDTSSCNFGEFLVETTNCSAADQFFIEFDLVGNEVDNFIVYVNEIEFDMYDSTELPILIGPYDGDCVTSYEIMVVDASDETCNLSYIQEPICCLDCEQTGMTAEAVCVEGEALFNLTINLESYIATSDSFELRGNGNNYGTFAYQQLPLVIEGLESDCALEYEFVIVDSGNEECNIFVVIDEICCEETPCEIGELSVEYDCNEDNETFDIWINAANYAGVSDSFILRGNGIIYGTYAYGQLPVTLFGLVADCETNYEFILIDSENEACTSDTGIGEVCCDIECELGELVVEYDCNDDNETFDISINTSNYIGVSDSFVLRGNGIIYGTYAYGQLPVTLFGLVADCETNYEFILIDSENETCSTDIGIGEVCCGIGLCEIGDLLIEYDCNEDNETFDLWINAPDYAGVSDSFTLQGNGNVYGTYAYEQLPITLFNLAADCELEYEIALVDSGDENCFSDAEIGTVCCQMDCELGELSVEFDCNDDQETFDIFINTSNYIGTSDSFILRGNGVIYGTFAYTQLPVTLFDLEADCQTNYEFILIDSENEECSTDIGIGEVCCDIEECEIEIEGLSVVECVEGEVTLVVEFIGVDLVDPGVSLFINDILVGEAGTDAQSIEISGYMSNEPQLGIVICQTESLTCCDGINIANPCYVDAINDELHEIDWRISNNQLALNNNSTMPLACQVMNYTGVVLMEAEVSINGGKVLDINSYPAGLYLLHMKNDKGQRTEKFIVK